MKETIQKYFTVSQIKTKCNKTTAYFQLGVFLIEFSEYHGNYHGFVCYGNIKNATVIFRTELDNLDLETCCQQLKTYLVGLRDTIDHAMVQVNH